MPKNYKIKWMAKPKSSNYLAALSYMSLHLDEKAAAACVKQLKRAPMSEFKSKDIFRASGLSLLGVSNERVKTDQKKIRAGRELSPILLVRHTPLSKVIIADGYHRLCAVYSYDENALIPCKIV